MGTNGNVREWNWIYKRKVSSYFEKYLWKTYFAYHWHLAKTCHNLGFFFLDTSVIFICVSGQFVVLKMACILWRCSEWLKSFFGGGRGEALKCENLGTIGDAVMMKWRQVMCLCKLFTDQRASYSPSPLPGLQVSGECLLAGHHSMSVSPNATNMFHLFWNPSCI